MEKKSAYNYDDLIKCGNGELFGPGNAKLPLPPMLMFDRITEIEENGGSFKKGILKQVLPLNVFKERCEKIHNKRYDLSRISYGNLHEKIEVGCKIEGHGFFETEANNFMRGLSNCKLCSAKETSIRCRKTTEDFIKKAKRKHKDNHYYVFFCYINIEYLITKINC